MKRFLLTWAIIIFAMALAACHETPETAVVIKKDTATLLEMAQRNGPQSDKSLSEQYDIPERYQFEMEASNGNLNIKVDARVIVPEGSRMPIFRVIAVPFSQEVSNVLFRELCGDTEMWHETPITKDRIQDEIIVVKRRIAELEANPELARDPDDLMWAISDLEYLEEQLRTAPKHVERDRADGKLRELTYPGTKKNYIGISAFERPANPSTDLGKVFFVVNDEEFGVFNIVYYDTDLIPGVRLDNAPAITVAEDADVSEDILSKVGFKPSEAIAMVQAYLNKAGMGMVVDSLYLRSDAQIWNNGGVVRPAENYQYDVYCVREVNGYRCSYVNQISTPENDATALHWMYETMTLSVNSNGIFGLMWFSPIEVIDTVIEDTQLLPFSDIKQTFERMMRVKFAPQASENYKLYFQIDRVTLSLHRIEEQNATRTGLLVPAWNFYGKLTVTYFDFEEGEQTEEFLGESFMTINAIDGSVIDNSKGY